MEFLGRQAGWQQRCVEWGDAVPPAAHPSCSSCPGHRAGSTGGSGVGASLAWWRVCVGLLSPVRPSVRPCVRGFTSR